MKRKITNYLQNSACMPGWREPEAEACPVEKGETMVRMTFESK